MTRPTRMLSDLFTMREARMKFSVNSSYNMAKLLLTLDWHNQTQDQDTVEVIFARRSGSKEYRIDYKYEYCLPILLDPLCRFAFFQSP